jgi:hypothetical protein
MNRKAQITPFMILVIVVLILAIAATMLIGEVAFQRIRLANIADSAVVSVASGFCRTLNQIRILHTKMFLNHITMQSMLLFESPWPSAYCDFSGASAKVRAWAACLPTLQQNASLYFKARSVAGDAAKDLRSSLYDIAFGGALVDEPEPFEQSEVIYDNVTGAPVGVNYTRYINRLNTNQTTFVQKFRQFKNTEKAQWYTHPKIAYSWNKAIVGSFIPGKLTNNGLPDNSYDSYLIVNLQNVPSKVSVSPMPMVAIYIYIKWKPCFPPGTCCPHPFPGFIFNPFAWIRKISINNNSFGLTLKKSIPFRRLPFFSRDVLLTHKNNLRIKGGVWTGYDFRMEQ